MRTVVNVSNVSYLSDGAPAVSFSNAVTTLIKEPSPQVFFKVGDGLRYEPQCDCCNTCCCGCMRPCGQTIYDCGCNHNCGCCTCRNCNNF